MVVEAVKIFISAFPLLLVALSTGSASENPDCSWPMYGHDQHHTSRSPCTGIATVAVRAAWISLDALADCSLTPDALSISSSGVLYFFPGVCLVKSGSVIALDPVAGTTRWITTLPAVSLELPFFPGVTAPVAVGDELVIVGIPGFVVALSATNGAVRWEYAGTCAPIEPPPVGVVVSQVAIESWLECNIITPRAAVCAHGFDWVWSSREEHRQRSLDGGGSASVRGQRDCSCGGVH